MREELDLVDAGWDRRVVRVVDVEQGMSSEEVGLLVPF